ncbi:MAG: 3-phosphoshikimate 1-carboxyvinyltransferase [Pelosinus sp.]|nr:3-phosphoshikimate 1-carboxyvinyltransferase [Pelosinus sp.]
MNIENQLTISAKKQLIGTIRIPGDKSISHRSIMLSGLASTPVVVKNFLFAADCCSTISCMQALGVQVEKQASGDLHIQGNGFYGLQEPKDILDAGNSGTTLRLLTGILACQPFFSVITGDASLRKRPMGRVVKPLSMMGCQMVGRQETRYIPLAIKPGENIRGIQYNMPVASAQVKSAILLAGLFAAETTVVTEPYLSRDHTERMLETFGVPIKRDGLSVSLEGVTELTAPAVIEVPGDISSAAFWLVAGSIMPDSQLTLENVGINPTRTGILDVLKEMGANISLINERLSGTEPIADLTIKSAQLQGVTIEGEIIPRLIDEIPILAVAALFAKGRTVIRGAEELRVKETDRLRAVTSELTKMGAKIEETPDGLIIDGPQKLEFAVCDSHDDHRMAMSLAIAGLAGCGVEINNPDCVRISYPDFFTVLDKVSL